MKFKTAFVTLLLLICMSIPYFTFAQADPPPDPIDTPIDSWLVVLLFAGVAYGYIKFRKRVKLSS